MPLSGLEAVVAGVLRDGSEAVWTLARARIAADACRVRIAREPGRTPLPVVTVNAGDSLVWDGRFRVLAMAKDAPVDPPLLGFTVAPPPF